MSRAPVKRLEGARKSPVNTSRSMSTEPVGGEKQSVLSRFCTHLGGWKKTTRHWLAQDAKPRWHFFCLCLFLKVLVRTLMLVECTRFTGALEASHRSKAVSSPSISTHFHLSFVHTPSPRRLAAFFEALAVTFNARQLCRFRCEDVA